MPAINLIHWKQLTYVAMYFVFISATYMHNIIISIKHVATISGSYRVKINNCFFVNNSAYEI